MSRGLGEYFPGLDQSNQRTVVSRPGFIEAWCCEGWMPGCEEQSATFLVVYRSPLVTDTSAMYKPVADIILAADHVEVIRSGVHEDASMMHGRGETLFVRLYEAGANPPYSLSEIRSMLKEKESSDWS